MVLTLIILCFAQFCSFAVTYTNYPEAVTCTPHGDLKTSVGFAWYTDTEVTDSVVQLRVAGDSSEFGTNPNLNFTGTCETVSHGALSYNVHKVVATGLNPGTKYEYRVGAPGYWSDAQESLNGVGYFETAPDHETEFTFINLGDINGGSVSSMQAFGNALRRAINLFPTSKFIMQNGDTATNMEDKDKKEQEWKWFFQYSQPYLMNTIWVGTIGNHDVSPDDTNYNQHFNYKSAGDYGTYFSFDYSNVHFINIDTNRHSQEQIDWAIYDVVRNGKRWNIAFFHAPLYSNGSHGNDTSTRRRWQEPLCDILGIDLIFTGHDHVYNRCYYLKDGLPVSDDTNKEDKEGIVTDPIGTLCVLPNCAATKFYTPDTSKNSDYIKISAQPNKSTYAGVTVSGDKLVCKVYYYDETKPNDEDKDVLLDQFGIIKTKQPPKPPENVKIDYDFVANIATITWEDTNTEFVRDYVIYDENNKYKVNWTHFMGGTEVKSYTITGITQDNYKDYSFVVKAVGERAFSDAARPAVVKKMNVNNVRLIDEHTGKVLVKGQIPVSSDFAQNQVVLLLRKKNAPVISKDEIAYIAQTTISRDGSYVFKFPFHGDINEYELMIRLGEELKNDTITKAVVDYRWIDAGIQIFKINDNQLSGEIHINNYYDVEGLTYTICLAFYDENNKLIGVSMKENVQNIGAGITTDDLRADIPSGAVKAAAMIWSNYTQMIPLGNRDDMIFDFLH